MRSWIVKGVDKHTTEPVIRVIDANDIAEAKAIAGNLDIVVLDISPAPRGMGATPGGQVDPNRLRAAMWIRSVANVIGWTGGVGCVLSVLMLKTPYVFGPLQPSMLAGFITMGVSIGLVYLGNALTGD